MDDLSTPDYSVCDNHSDYLAPAEAAIANDEGVMPHACCPKASTLRFLRQMARCCISTPGVSIPALSSMMAN